MQNGDIGAPMGQMKNADGHNRKTVIGCGQMMFSGVLTLSAAHLVFPFHRACIPLSVIKSSPARPNFLRQLFPVVRLGLQARQIILISPLSNFCADVVQPGYPQPCVRGCV